MAETNISTNCTNDLTLAAHSAPTYFRILLSVFPALMTLFTIIGNGFVIIAIRVNRRLTRKRTSILVLNLALADFFVGGGVMPFGVSQIVNENRWLFGRILCKIWTSLDVICCTASIFTLCIISMDRWIGVTRPLRYSYIVTRGRLWSAVVTVWTLSLAVLLLTVHWTESPCVDIYVCRVGDELQYVVHSVIMSFFIPLVVILVVHYKIYQVTRRREVSLLHSAPRSCDVESGAHSAAPPAGGKWFSHITYYYRKLSTSTPERRNSGINTAANDQTDRSRARDERRRSSGHRPACLAKGITTGTLRVHYGGNDDDVIKQRKFYAKHKKTAKTLALVVGAFLFCWLPFFIFYLISSTCNDECIPAAVMEAFTWLGYSNSAINPVIYAVSMKSFGGDIRKTLYRVFSFCLCQRMRPSASYGNLRRGHRLGSLSSAPVTVDVTECTHPISGSCRHAIAIKGDDGSSSTSSSITSTRRQRVAIASSPKRSTVVVRIKGGKMKTKSKCRPTVSAPQIQTKPTEFVFPPPRNYNHAQQELEQDELIYEHSFAPACEDDSDIESSFAVAANTN